MSKEPQWTPGPWTVSDDIYAFTDETGAWEISSPAGHNWIAKVLTEPNARLAAAAPELYEALLRIMSTATDNAADLKYADMALRKARGDDIYC